MKSSIALTIALVLIVAAACFVDTGDAWGFSRRRGDRGGRGGRGGRGSSGYGSWNATKIRRNTTQLTARCVDDPHPYFRAFEFSVNATLSDLQANLSSFCNNTAANLTLIVKNDYLAVTRDSEVKRMGYKDRLEVWFSDSGPTTRAKTAYALSKEARKVRKEKKERKERRKRPGRPQRGDRRQRPDYEEFEDDYMF